MTIQHLYPTTRPSLDLNFARTKRLDPRVTFTRGSTATYVGSDGLIKTAASNEARFDHDPVTGESLGLLVEEARSNELPNSMPTTSGGTGITNTQVTGLPGVFSTARRFTSGGGIDVRIILGSNTFGVKFTYSFYARLGTQGTSAFIRNGTNEYVNFNLSTGVPNNSGWDSGSAYMIDVGNGWYRCYASVTGSGASGFLFGVANGNDLSSNAGDNIIAGGFQIEQGAFPTSYIPTSGSTVTRSADVASMTGTNFSSWYNQSEGALLFTQKTSTSPTNSTYYYLITTGGTVNGYRIAGQVIPADAAGANAWSSTASWLSLYPSPTAGFQNMAFAYSDGSAATAKNGAILETNTEALAAVTPTVLSIAYNVTSTIARLTYYPTRLTDAQLQALTL